MDINQFVDRFADQFFDIDPATITPSTAFREIDGFSSLVALAIIAMVDEEYGVQLTGRDIRSSVTVEDLFNVVKEKRA